MMVALEAHYPCNPCGYRLRLVMTATAHVNKRSVRLETFIGAAPRACPECQTVTPPPDRPEYTLTAQAAEEIHAYRLRRWPELALEASAKTGSTP